MSFRTLRLDRPVGLAVTLALALLILGNAYWLMSDAYGRVIRPRGEGIAAQVGWLLTDPFANFRLRGDDFPYLANSRTTRALQDHLLEPHNAHVVPLFRLWTHLVGRAAGDLARLPMVIAWSSFGTLVAVMLLGGHLVAVELKDRALGLAAMLGLGVTTVMQPAATWYSAGQTLWAGLCVLVMLLALQRWRRVDGVSWLVLAALAAMAAPAFWSGGFAAGPVGAVYLLAERRACHRKAALVPLAAVGVVGALMLLVATDAGGISMTALELPGRVLGGIAHTARAIPEALVLNNLGLDAPTSTTQGLILVGALVALWGWSRGGVRPTPIEAAGATLIATCYLMSYSFRGDMEFANLRDLRWYHAMPQIGAVLLAAGWWSVARGANDPADPRPSSMRGMRPVTRRMALVLLGMTAALQILHAPRAQQLFLATVPPISEAERLRFPIPELQRLRGLYLASEDASRQNRALARLDRAEAAARKLGIDADAIRQAVVGPIRVPGWPEHVAEPDALALLDLPPPAGGPVEAARVAAALAPLLAPEPERRPEWLSPDAPWPPPGGDD